MSRVLITGVSSGLGAELMRLNLAAGREVTGVVRRAEQREQLMDDAPAGLRVLVADLSEPDEVRALGVELAGERFDHVVLNAGSADVGALAELPPESIDRTLQTNLLANMHLSRALLPGAIEHGTKLVFVSSICARLPGIRFASYAVSKAGLSQLANSLRVECPGLEVLCLELGGVATPFHRKAGLADHRPKHTAGNIARRMQRAIETQTGVRTLVPTWWLARRFLMVFEGSIVRLLRWKESRGA